MLGEVPDHPIDSSVGVIRVDDHNGNPIAVAFRYSCHPVTMGPRSAVASSDFPGVARSVVESSIGGLALFLQGGGGNDAISGGGGQDNIAFREFGAGNADAIGSYDANWDRIQLDGGAFASVVSTIATVGYLGELGVVGWLVVKAARVQFAGVNSK